MNQDDVVILVDENDQQQGTEEKMKAHRLGLCHRAFSVFVFNKEGDDLSLLLQQRQFTKYHCPGLWTNTCCSHPRPSEKTRDAAHRRLQMEMGFDTDLSHAGRFHYIAHFDNGLSENEVDHVFVGTTQQQIPPHNPEEVAKTEWVKVRHLLEALETHPERYTPWFAEALTLALHHPLTT